MTSFAPVYRPKPSQRSFLEQQRQESERRKRKRHRESEGGQQDDALLSTDPTAAGHPIEERPPKDSFPHAEPQKQKRVDNAVRDELDQAKPHIYLPRNDTDNDSAERQHIDTLTAILHKCVLEGDWKRASRAFGLLMRTEIHGENIDIRRNDLWRIGAEILMRREHPSGAETWTLRLRREQPTETEPRHEGDTTTNGPTISEQGFRSVKEYYERLILQYPHESEVPHDAVDGADDIEEVDEPDGVRDVDALVFYPALFSVWIFEVQDRWKRARERIKNADPDQLLGDLDDEEVREILNLELAEAQAILQRLEDLSAAPPYDINADILRYSGFVGAWVSDLHKDVADSYSRVGDDVEMDDNPDVSIMSVEDDRAMAKKHHLQAQDGRKKARSAFQKMVDLGMEVSDQVKWFLTEIGEDETMNV